MAFELDPNKSVGNEVKRSVRGELDEALDLLRAHDQEEKTVHEARKSFKKVRAALRLVRDELGDAEYRRKNFLFRDAAQPLTEVRDAKILVEAFDNLTKHFAAEIEAGKFDKVREGLVANQRTVTDRVLKDEKACACVVEMVESEVDCVKDWTIDRKGWSALAGGLKRTYRAGHRALSAAVDKASMENLHELRKQAKYLRYQLQLLEPVWASIEKGLGDEVYDLTQILGDDHDLAVLHWLVSTDPMKYGGYDVVKSLNTLIARRHEELQRQAFDCGRHVYRDSPKVFTNRIKGCWDGSRAAAPVRILAQPEPKIFARRIRRDWSGSRYQRAASVRILAWSGRSLGSRIKGMPSQSSSRPQDTTVARVIL